MADFENMAHTAATEVGDNFKFRKRGGNFSDSRWHKLVAGVIFARAGAENAGGAETLRCVFGKDGIAAWTGMTSGHWCDVWCFTSSCAKQETILQKC